MRLEASLALCLLLGGVALAKDPPNTLSKRETKEGYQLLFDGTTLTGWAPRGKAVWSVKDGEIVVEAGQRGVLGSLVAASDFRLKLEVWIDGVANSGVFLRAPGSGALGQQNAYEVNLYDAHPTWPTGSVNGVAKSRGKVKTSGRWSRIEVTAKGVRLQVKVNGKIAVKTKDTRHREGCFGLQYNGQGVVKFRNLKLLPLAPTWRHIFDGRTLSGWARRGDANWKVANGLLVAKSGSGVLATKESFSDFRLRLEFWIDDDANSGVFLRAPTTGTIGQANAYEVNLFDAHPKWPTGSVNGVAKNPHGPKTTRRWNTLEVLAQGAKLVVTLNGEAVVTTNDPKHSAGSLGLQYNGRGVVKFRNVRIQPVR
ncbi:MAG: DUF1080 domain-containing protein [Planctomycetes bacterium]|nr:DUF1080 domain-containing protein [Planctomycetota bacterium]